MIIKGLIISTIGVTVVFTFFILMISSIYFATAIIKFFDNKSMIKHNSQMTTEVADSSQRIAVAVAVAACRKK